MPFVQPGSKILVTGADGYIGSWLVQTLLEQGCSIRASVLQTSTFLQGRFGLFGDRFEQLVVEDITKPGAFDEAVKGIDAIVHLASPVSNDIEDPKEMIGPAVNGTTGILKSAVNVPCCRRIVVISSLSAVFRVTNEPMTINEDVWNEDHPQSVEKLGRNAPGIAKYGASKTLAEKAAWTFYREHEAHISWDMVTILPPWIFGPTLVPHSSLEDVNWSLKVWYNAILDPESCTKTLMERTKPWMDVRDLVQAIAKSLIVPEAGGERILLNAGSATWQNWIDVVNSLSPSPIPSHAPGTKKELPKGSPEGKNAPHVIDYDASKAERILGVKYRSKEETARDTLADFERRGW